MKKHRRERFGGRALRLDARVPAVRQWISDIDGTNREPRLQASVDAGWETESMLGGAHMIFDSRHYFAQRHATQAVRHGFIEFAGP